MCVPNSTKQLYAILAQSVLMCFVSNLDVGYTDVSISMELGEIVVVVILLLGGVVNGLRTWCFSHG